MLGNKIQSTPSDITLIWLGWAFTLFILQLLHFIFPITIYVVVPILIIGLLFSRHQIVEVFRLRSQKRTTVLKFAGILFIMLALTSWIALRSMLPPENFDFGLIINVIRWINSFPIIPGLGNLHGRLAFNQSFFLYAAALNFHPYFDHGRSIANSFLFLLTFATYIVYLHPSP